MKKIVLIMALMISLTACGSKDNTKENFTDENLIEEKNVDLVNEDKDVVEEKTVDLINKDEDVIEEKTIIENKGEEEIIENAKNKREENDIKIVECAEDVQEPGVNPIEEKTVYEEGVEIGKKAIDFEVELLTGEKVRLSDYLGKPIFLNFWATWCGPCVGEMPDIEKIKNEYGDKLVVLLVNGGESKEDVQSFITKKGYTFYVGLDEKGEILTVYDSMYIPLSIFIDENGIIKDRKVGALSEENMKTIVKDLINME